jgi:major membrane immunogen (membrane-anchored lipoprotein)
MELIGQKASVELTVQQGKIIEGLCDAAWKAGGIRSPQDGQALEDLRTLVKAAFLPKAEKEAM